jgi:hypothetical protein
VIYTSEILAALVEVREKADRVANSYETWLDDDDRPPCEGAMRNTMIEVQRFLLHDLTEAIHKLDGAEDKFEDYIAGIVKIRLDK